MLLFYEISVCLCEHVPSCMFRFPLPILNVPDSFVLQSIKAKCFQPEAERNRSKRDQSFIYYFVTKTFSYDQWKDLFSGNNCVG